MGIGDAPEELKHSVVRVGQGEEQRFYKFLFAALNPVVFVAFTRLFPEGDDEALRALSLCDGSHMEWEHSFWFEPASFCYTNEDEEEVFAVDQPEVAILRIFTFPSATRVCGDGNWVPWAHYSSGCISSRRKDNDEEPSRQARPSSALLVENQWLWDIAGGALPRGRYAQAALDNDAAQERRGGDEADPEEVMASLAAARAEIVGAAQGAATTHFAWTVRGGCWTRSNRGVVYDSFRSAAVSVEGKEFARRHGLAASATFSLSRYGEQNCSIFCRYWCDKMAFFFRALGSDPRAPGAGSGAQPALDGFQEPPAFVALASATPEGVVAARIRGLRALRPVA